MIEKVKAIIKEKSLIQKSGSVLLAVSGGPDSVAMADIFNKIKRELGFKMALAYFHHGIRSESDLELKYVKDLAAKFNADFFTDSKNIPVIADKEGRSLEDVARRERYYFLTTTARSNSYNKIAVAHNKDDQSETFLHRLIRGSGLRGFQGMAYESNRDGISIIRPLLGCFRKEIEDYIKLCGITACQDDSNYDTKFTRNKIRHELISYLEHNFNPNIKEVLFNTSCSMQELYDFVESQTYTAFKRCVKKEGSCVNINQDSLKKLHPYIITEVIRMAFEFVKGDLKRFEYAHYKEIESLIYERPAGSVVDLPAGIKAVKNKHWLTIGR